MTGPPISDRVRAGGRLAAGSDTRAGASPESLTITPSDGEIFPTTATLGTVRRNSVVAAHPFLLLWVTRFPHEGNESGRFNPPLAECGTELPQGDDSERHTRLSGVTGASESLPDRRSAGSTAHQGHVSAQPRFVPQVPPRAEDLEP